VRTGKESCAKEHSGLHRERVRCRMSKGFQLEDAGFLLLLAFMAPVAILLLGTPVALAVRLLLELVRRF